MKKHIAITLLLACVLLLASCTNSKYARVVDDYDTSALKGSFLSSDNEAYRIGKNSLGRPVFRDTEKAWEAFIKDYAVGISAIKAAFNLDPISKQDY